MEKLVTLKLKGDFERGFDAILQFEVRVTTEVTRGFKKVKAETTNFSCVDLANQLKEQLNIWLKSADGDWQNIRDCLQQNLHPNEETRLIIKTTNPQLRRLPLSVWELFDDAHFKAEIALSSSQFYFS